MDDVPFGMESHRVDIANVLTQSNLPLAAGATISPFVRFVWKAHEQTGIDSLRCISYRRTVILQDEPTSRQHQSEDAKLRAEWLISLTMPRSNFRVRIRYLP
ncbi:hypothetical protein IFM47457_05156 [Aspergillus lentulus]|nr:hypothetical protein IFM47457_05156 [Aspergillus lentulus]